MTREESKKLTTNKKKEDSRYVRKQTFSDKTSYTMRIIEEEKTTYFPFEDEENEIFSEEALLCFAKLLMIINELTPRDRLIYLANTIGRVSVWKIEEILQKPIKHSMILKIIKKVKKQVAEECQKVDINKKISSPDSKRKPANYRAKYF
ncbi:MAG: hypothetical protein C4541_04910 [Candidatus Auribacter fodinae]|jgi:hypothetical protein|uniref:Uncharacterized protein n=1 Tax=Candidatus Auribacter fodinae TaxID=2093366 RepID=A0A3A4R1X0_9BACT|nr:MAG: hypothetical protein C4541_04910 [Candidatus Auribacter fodinae]